MHSNCFSATKATNVNSSECVQQMQARAFDGQKTGAVVVQKVAPAGIAGLGRPHGTAETHCMQHLQAQWCLKAFDVTQKNRITKLTWRLCSSALPLLRPYTPLHETPAQSLCLDQFRTPSKTRPTWVFLMGTPHHCVLTADHHCMQTSETARNVCSAYSRSLGSTSLHRKDEACHVQHLQVRCLFVCCWRCSAACYTESL